MPTPSNSYLTPWPAPDDGNGDDDEAHPAMRLSQSAFTLRLAVKHFDFLVDGTRAVYSIAKGGRGRPEPLDALGGHLQALYALERGDVISNSLVGSVLSTLCNLVRHSDPPLPRASVWLRCARYGDGIVVDLGDPDNTGCVVIDSAGWRTEAVSPVYFRTTELTGQLPEPTRDGLLVDLRVLLNVTDEDWPLVAAWLVAAYMPNIPRPILWLTGVEGTAKSTITRFLISLVDPPLSNDRETSPGRSPSESAKDWAVAASGSYLIALENLSSISQQMSDQMCKAVTGDTFVARTLFTNAGLTVLTYRRVLLVNGISPGPLRGDLAHRALPVPLQLIGHVMTEDELDQLYLEWRPRILGAIFDLLARVLVVLPSVEVAELPRMADFARVLAAVDQLLGTKGLDTYKQRLDDVAVEVVEGDPVLLAVDAFAHARFDYLGHTVPAGCFSPVWEGTAADLLQELNDARGSWERVPRHWPETPSVLSRRLRQAARGLRVSGIEVELPEPTGHNRERKLLLWLRKEPSAPSAPSAGASADGADATSEEETNTTNTQTGGAASRLFEGSPHADDEEEKP